MQPPDKVVLEHTGALGDFLLAWPIFLSLARHFRGRSLYSAVPPAHTVWLAPLAAPCPPDLRRALDARFAGDRWPDALVGTLVVRPGLAIRPDVPQDAGFWFLRGLESGRTISPTRLYAAALARHGIPFDENFAMTFRECFGRHAPQGNTALLFPGAGHKDKAWPLSFFEYLASVLQKRGVQAVFVLGPAERERGLHPDTGTILCPENMDQLSTAIRTARFVVGPDCGPMHLAALHGVPGLVLFGPTSPSQWGPPGMNVMTAALPCAPCTAITSGDFAAICPRPLPCLTAITPAMVLDRLYHLGLIPGRA